VTRTLTALSARRRHPLAVVVLIALALLLVGGLYAALAPRDAQASTATASADDVEAGKKRQLRHLPRPGRAGRRDAA
jgi:ubiquinol-cytochrome c reductase cytochrome c subunit